MSVRRLTGANGGVKGKEDESGADGYANVTWSVCWSTCMAFHFQVLNSTFL